MGLKKQGEGQDHDESVEEVGGNIPEKGGLPELILLFGFQLLLTFHKI